MAETAGEADRLELKEKQTGESMKMKEKQTD
jgi:hypothetical protein